MNKLFLSLIALSLCSGMAINAMQPEGNLLRGEFMSPGYQATYAGSATLPMDLLRAPVQAAAKPMYYLGETDSLARSWQMPDDATRSTFAGSAVLPLSFLEVQPQPTVAVIAQETALALSDALVDINPSEATASFGQLATLPFALLSAGAAAQQSGSVVVPLSYWQQTRNFVNRHSYKIGAATAAAVAAGLGWYFWNTKKPASKLVTPKGNDGPLQLLSVADANAARGHMGQSNGNAGFASANGVATHSVAGQGAVRPQGDAGQGTGILSPALGQGSASLGQGSAATPAIVPAPKNGNGKKAASSKNRPASVQTTPFAVPALNHATTQAPTGPHKPTVANALGVSQLIPHFESEADRIARQAEPLREFQQHQNARPTSPAPFSPQAPSSPLIEPLEGKRR